METINKQMNQVKEGKIALKQVTNENALRKNRSKNSSEGRTGTIKRTKKTRNIQKR